MKMQEVELDELMEDEDENELKGEIEMVLYI